MFGSGRPRRPQVVAFDIIGTVFPLEPLRSSVMALGLPSAGLEGWFAAGCRDAFAMAAVGDYEPFATVLEYALDQVLAEQGLDPPARDRKVLVGQLETLVPRDGAREAFSTLQDAGIPVMALSNGSASATRKLLAQDGLDAIVAHVVSVDEVKLAKPRGEVYRHAASAAGVEPPALALFAMHPWDVNGAAATGLVTGYLTAGGSYPSTMRSPELEGDTLVDLARQIAAM